MVRKFLFEISELYLFLLCSGVNSLQYVRVGTGNRYVMVSLILTLIFPRYQVSSLIVNNPKAHLLPYYYTIIWEKSQEVGWARQYFIVSFKKLC